MSTTPFVETEALLAVMEDNDARLTVLLEGMLPGERRALANAAQRLANSASIGAPSSSTRRSLMHR